jgi:1-phosphofructokinase
MIYTVTLNPALDYVMQVPKMKTGETNRSKTEEIQFGGKGINVSVMLHRLGQPTVALGFIAGFTGDKLESLVQKTGVKTDFIRLTAGETRINVKIKGETETEINAGGPPIDANSFKTLCEKLQILQDGDTLVLAGSIPTSLPANTYQTLIECIEHKNIRLVVDATGDALLSTLSYHPFLVKPNRAELEQLRGYALSTMDEIWEAAAYLQQKGAKNVLVSLGGDGAALLDETGKKHILPAPKGRVKNSVGAGDSMVAGFLTGVKDGYAIALKWGVAAGSATAFCDGLAIGDDVKRLVQQL